MARKFFLIPSDQYEHMLSSTSSAAEPLMTYTEKRMKSLLKGGKKGKRGKRTALSVRKALYDQELGRYLKQRKEKMERPVKVELVDKGGVKAQAVVKEREGGVGKIATVAPERETTPPQLPFPSPAVMDYPHSAPARTKSKPVTPSDDSPIIIGGVTRRREATKNRKQTKEAKIAEFKKAVYDKRKDLGITDEGNILRRGSVIEGSNYEDIVNEMVSHDAHKFRTLKGWDLHHKIMQDKSLTTLLNGIVGTIKPSGRGKTPGIKLENLKQSPKSPNTPKRGWGFKPTLWT
jgi:hypothetical protein